MPERFVLGGAGNAPAITVARRTLSYADLNSMVDRVEFPPAGALDLAGLGVSQTLAAVFAAAGAGTAVLVRSPDSPVPSLPVFPPDTFLVAMTSGTSGRPRAVVRTADSWAASFRPLADIAGLTSQDVVLLTGPLHATMHLFTAVHTLWLGAHLTDDPAAATAAHAVPTVLADVLTDPPRQLRTVVVAGAALPHALECRALETSLTLVEYYGAAELSFVATRVAPGRLRAFPGVEVRIADGELWARSPYLALGRFDLAADTPELNTMRTDDGFATVGDLVTVDADGSLTIRGRGDAAVTTGGHTVLVEDVEAVIATLPGVAAVAVVGTAHRRLGQVLTAVVELTEGVELAGIRRAARHQLTGAALPRRWQAVAALPRTGGGKIARAQVVAQLDCGPPNVGEPG